MTDATGTGLDHGLLEQVRKVWEELLDCQVADDDDFFELGGYSMLAMELCQRLRDDEHDVSVAELVHHSRLTDFAAAVGSARPTSTSAPADAFESMWAAAKPPSAARTSAVSRLHKGTGSPIYVVHWGTGNIQYLSHLSGVMGGGRPMHGVSNPGIRERVRTHLSVRDIAAQYTQQVLASGEGRVLLAGLCSGGYVAVEMARILGAAGVDVPLVGLINTMPPDEPVGFHLGAGLRELYEARLAYLSARFGRHDLADASEDVLRQLVAPDVAYHDPDTPTEDFFWLQALWAGLAFAQVHYEPESYRGAVHVFQTREASALYPSRWSGYLPSTAATTYDVSSTLPIIRHLDFQSDFRAAFDSAADG